MEQIPKQLQRVLVACSGEAAARTAISLRAAGLESVVLFREYEADAPWLDDADYATLLPGAFENGVGLLSVAMDAGVDALINGTQGVNDELIQMLSNTGLGWIGPRAELAEIDHEEARKLAKSAGLEPLPEVEVRADVSWVDRLGVPVVLRKATGKLSMAHTSDELVSLVKLAEPGDRVERLLVGSRTVVIPVIGDGKGGGVFLPGVDLGGAGDVWESPPPVMSEGARAVAGAAAARLVQDSCWFGVLGVKVQVDAHGRAWFLGIQSSLPEGFYLTDVVAGVDLVGAQVSLSLGEKIGWNQEEIVASRHAIGLTIRALADGVLEKLVLPEGLDAVVLRGEYGEITAGEPLVGIRVSAPMRHAALVRARVALDALEIEGVYTNLHTLKERISTRSNWDLK